MKAISKSILFFILASCINLITDRQLHAQAETVSINHPVYDYLDKLKIDGSFSGYNDMILPLSRKEIFWLLDSLSNQSEKQNIQDTNRLNYFKNYFAGESMSGASSLVNGDLSLNEYLSSEKENHFFIYNDGSLTLSINPVITVRNIFSDYKKSSFKNSTLISYGGALKLNYSDWLALYLEGSNGYAAGNRETAKLDRRVEQSFAFNETGLSFFDNTAGYIRAEYDIFSAEFGRQRILWGVSSLNRNILSEIPQTFDYIKLGIHHKIFTYDFLHGWLVQPARKIFKDSVAGDIKQKNPKFIAMSRIGINIFDNLNVGISQSVIYANRPAEAGYLNPFLLWESAQRSMNDLDNGFLILDADYFPFDGNEIYLSLVLDDFNLDIFNKEKWNSASNRMAWQIGTVWNEPLNFKDLTFYLDYMQVRPFTYSHPAVGEALSYTNNSYPLGADVDPNSTLFTARLRYQFSNSIKAELEFRNRLHGANELDESGNITRNVGGSYFRSYGWDTVSSVYLLDGILEVNNSYRFTLNYYYSYNINFELDVFHWRQQIRTDKTNYTAVSLFVRYNIF